MKVLVISDEIDQLVYSSNIKNRFADIDLVISCGDLPYNYYDFIVTSLNVPLFYVRGNHRYDKNQHKRNRDRAAAFGDHTSGYVNLDNKIVEYKGYLFGGFEGSKRYNKDSMTCQYSDSEMRWKILRTYPRLWMNKFVHGRGIDVLVTHAPPLGINDLPDLCHTGFRPFLGYLNKFKPKFLLHGHVHLYDRNSPRSAIFGLTEVVNCYGYSVIELTP